MTSNGFVTAIKPPFSKVCAVSLKDFPALNEFFLKKVLVFVARGSCQVHVVKLVSI